MLGQIPNRGILGNHDLSAVGGFFAHDNLQERRFSRAVDTDNGDLFFLVDMEVDILQNFLCAECF